MVERRERSAAAGGHRGDARPLWREKWQSRSWTPGEDAQRSSHCTTNLAMARTSGQTDGEARRTPSTSASSGFTQSYSVVEKANSNGIGNGSTTTNGHEDASSTSTSTGTSTASRFKSNSATMAQRAVQDTRDTLLWVTRFGEGAVDRVALRDAVRPLAATPHCTLHAFNTDTRALQARTMKQSQYRDILTERWVNGCCSYPPCGKAPRRAYSEDPVVRPRPS